MAKSKKGERPNTPVQEPDQFDAAWQRYVVRVKVLGLDPDNCYLPADDPRSKELYKALRDYDADLAELRAAALPTIAGKTQPQPSLVGKGVSPRDAWFLAQYEARGTDTCHKPAKIHAMWDAMKTTERAAICPDATNKIAKSTIDKIIKRAKRKT